MFLFLRRMGKHSPEAKRSKRKRQKVRRKLDFVHERTCDSNPCPSSEDDQELTYSYSYEDTLGIDLDAFQMSLETEDNEDLPYEYLLDCRKKLIRKIEWYRKQLDTSTSENTYLVSKHRAEIRRIKTFYQNIAFGRSHSGKLVKRALCTGKAASEFMKELNAKYRQTLNDY